MVEISVIVRTCNEEKWIGHCLRSVTEQTLDNVRIILVDNLSSDKTVAKARNVCPDLTLVEIDDYMPGKALNKGVRASSGEYFVCLSAHCIPVNDEWLANLRRNFDEETDVAGVYGRQVPIEASDPVDKRDLVRTFGPERRVQRQDTFFHNANSMIRRDVWDDYPFKEDVTNIEDQIWGNEIINASYTLVYEPDAAVYHHHGINQSNDKTRTRSVVQTMENNDIRPDDPLSIEDGPLTPSELDIVSIIPVRQQSQAGVDSNEPLITQTIEAAQNAEYIDDIFLSTDSEYLAEKASKWGVKAPFLRPPELSEADVAVVDVHSYSLEQLEDDGRLPDLVVPLEITHPFRPLGMIDKLIVQLLRNDHDSVVASFPEYRPCWKSNGNLERVNEDGQFRADRQPVQIGLPSLGCVTYPQHLRQGERIGGDVGVYEVSNPIATVEVRKREDLKYWERLKDVPNLLS